MFNITIEELAYEVVIGSQSVRSAFAKMGRRMFRSFGPMDRGRHAFEGMLGFGE